MKLRPFTLSFYIHHTRMVYIFIDAINEQDSTEKYFLTVRILSKSGNTYCPVMNERTNGKC